MKNKELKYFTIEKSLGGNQSWFTDKLMYIGGCAAITACDLCLYLSLNYNRKELYPFDPDKLTKSDFLAFGKVMKPYLRPRITGVNTLQIYLDGAHRYFSDHHAKDLRLEGFPGSLSVEAAKNKVRHQIDHNLPIPFLLLRHKNPELRNLVWHWFIVGGYKEYDKQFFVKIITYGNYHWINFEDLWDTGYAQKGGMIILNQLKTSIDS